MAGRGILLLNLGGPGSLREVRPFLYRLFSDPAILVGVPAPLRQLLAATIAAVKGTSSVRAYRAIGGGSPQLHWTQVQAEGLTRALRDTGDRSRVAIGLRASRPRIADGLEQLRAANVEELLLLPLFPQYSTTTTASCFAEARRVLRRWRWSPRVAEVRSWPDHPAYLRVLRATVEEITAKAEAEREGAGDGELHVLLSAHSLPMRIVVRGDPYPSEVDRTVRALTRDLPFSWSLAYQSRNGKMPWLRPYVEEELCRLGQAGVRRVAVVPISFVSDHIETLWELDVLYAKLARKVGIRKYYRSRAFNGDPEFQRALAEIVGQADAGDR